MNATVHSILSDLRRVEVQRSLRDSDQLLGRKVLELKHYQQHRFARTYRDLLESRRFAAAARFFLDELYGPRDYSARDAQFARVVPALVRLFPADVVDTVATLGKLHALSEELDTQMAQLLVGSGLERLSYVRAWQACGQRTDRELQVSLTLEVGRALDLYTRNPWLRSSLRMMRGPARLAGLSELQQFLEFGFDTFRDMAGADGFLEIVQQRELTLLSRLFDPGAVACATVGSFAGDDPLGQLP